MPEATRRVAWRVVAPLIAGTIVTVPLGSYVLLVVDSTIMKQAIIAAVVAISVVMLFGWRYRRVLNAFQLTGVGALSGALLSSAFIGAVVPIFLYAGPDAAARSRANVIIWAFVSGLLVTATLSYGGAITKQSYGVRRSSRRSTWSPPFAAAGSSGESTRRCSGARCSSS